MIRIKTNKMKKQKKANMKTYIRNHNIYESSSYKGNIDKAGAFE